MTQVLDFFEILVHILPGVISHAAVLNKILFSTFWTMVFFLQMFFMVVPKVLKVKKTENAYLCINEGGIFFVRSDCISDV